MYAAWQPDLNMVQILLYNGGDKALKDSNVDRTFDYLARNKIIDQPSNPPGEKFWNKLRKFILISYKMITSSMENITKPWDETLTRRFDPKIGLPNIKLWELLLPLF